MLPPFIRPKTGTMVLGPPLIYGDRVVGSVFEALPLKRLRIGDTLLCRGGSDGVFRDFIRISGRGAWYHAAKFTYREGVSSVIEMIEDIGGRELFWDRWLAERDGFVDVFRPDVAGRHGYDRRGAVEWMRRNIVGKPYGRDVIRRFARQESWLTCWWNRPCIDPKAPPPTSWVCSTAAACADAYGGGVNPVYGLWPGDVQPCNLARANLNEYVMTFAGGPPTAKE